MAMLEAIPASPFDPASFEEMDTMVNAFFLSTSRLMALFVVVPFFQKSNVPNLVRVGLAISLSFITYPKIFDQVSEYGDMAHLELAGFLTKEVFLGAMMGLVVGLPAWAVEAAGSFIDTQRGASIGSTQSPVSQNETQPTGAFLLFAYICWMFVSGAFSILISLLYDSYSVWPVLSFFPTLDISSSLFFINLLDRMMGFALLMAGPVMLSMFLGELSLIFVARFAPQLNVFILAMPVKSGIAFLILTVYMPFLFETMEQGFNKHLELIKVLWRFTE